MVSVSPNNGPAGTVIEIQIIGPVGQVLTVKVGNVACDIMEKGEESLGAADSESMRKLMELTEMLKSQLR